MKPSIESLRDILYSASQYVIPVFQRNYRWEEPQWAKLWDSLIEIQKPEKKGNHFMGFLVFVPGLAQPGQNTKFHLIDGQQRLTTASILLAAVRNVAQHNDCPELAEEIHDEYLIHLRKPGEQRYRLLPKDGDRASYLALIERKEVPGGRIAGALAYFEEKISNHTNGDPERLRQVFFSACQRFEFMCATLETENAYNIFKSLNSTGVPLGQADLIRNFVYMHLPPELHDEFEVDLWGPLEIGFVNEEGVLDGDEFSKFFRDVLMADAEVGYVPPSATFERFESKYEATEFVPQQLGAELIKRAADYSIISGRVLDDDARVVAALARLNQLESSTTYPLVLALFERRSLGAIDSGHLARAIDMISGFILRRFICGESSRGYGRIFVRAVGLLGEEPVTSLERYLVGRGWPDDRRFTAAFVEFPLYQRGYARAVLVALEQQRGHKEPADLTATQIEHILPQTLTDAWRAELGDGADILHADWLHRPGNLTLSAYNQELWNHPFAMKSVRFKQSNVVLTREVGDFARWGVTEIRERGAQLAEAAAKIWVGPSAEAIAAGQNSGDDGADEDQDLTPLRQIQLDFWTEFYDLLQEETGWNVRRKPQPWYWMDVPIGRQYFTMSVFILVREDRMGVSLTVAGPNKAEFYQQLYSQKEVIEAEVGEPLEWFEFPEKQSSYVQLIRHGVDLKNRAMWPEYLQWMVDGIQRFNDTFRERVRDLSI